MSHPNRRRRGTARPPRPSQTRPPVEQLESAPPPHDPRYAPPPHRQQRSSDYEHVADKVGFVPNVRGKDNLFQLAAVLAFAAIGGAIGYVAPGGGDSAMSTMGLGVVGGLIVGVLVSGLVIGIVGTMRK